MEQIIEYLIITVIVLSILIGLRKGFVKIFFSWFSVLLGGVVALNFSYGLTSTFFSAYSHNILIVFGVGVVLFMIVYLILTNIAHSFSSFLQNAQIGGLDNLLGGIFGGAQMLIIAGLVIYWITSLGWVNMQPYPVSMFSAYWAETIVLLIGVQIDMVNKLL